MSAERVLRALRGKGGGGGGGGVAGGGSAGGRRSGFDFARLFQRPDWMRRFVLCCAALLLVLAVNAVFGEVAAGSAWGRAYGVLATLLMLAAAALGVRRRTMSRAPGRAQTWVQVHVYGGTLFMLLTLMHAGFRWPRERLTWWLLILSAWVTASGLLGVGLRKWIPRILTSGLRIEVIYERVPELAAEVRRRADALASSSSTAVQDFYRKEVAPSLRRPEVRPIYFLDITGGIQRRLRNFEFLRRLLAPADRERFAELESLLRTKLELDAHYTLQRALRWWLYAHVPVSLVLLLLVALHLVSVLYY
jgi:hypothetical protein